MARIRTIQPNFPRSTSMARVSRDARLLFVLLWTVADDAGRARAAPDGLAALLYASDPDAPMCLPGWLDELEREGSIERYTAGEVEYLRVVRWRKHQKIDRPTPSRLPAAPSEPRAPREGSRAAREESPESPREWASSDDGREKMSSEGPREDTEEGVLDDLEQILREAKFRGVFTPALRAVELKGQRLGMWSGRKKKEAASATASPALRDVIRQPGSKMANR